VKDYLGLLLPIALTNALGTLECVRAAQEAGDNYSSVETMLVDGIGSSVGALFGSPFGTTVYLGHPAYKKFGASRGYSLLNGTVFFLMSIFGFHGILYAIIPKQAVLPTILFVGFMIATETTELTPKRWRPAVLLGMLIPMFDWVQVIMGDAVRHVLNPVNNFGVDTGEVGTAKVMCVEQGMQSAYLTLTQVDPNNSVQAGQTIGSCLGTEYWKTLDTFPGYAPGHETVSFMANGYLFISLMWTLGFIALTDRQMLKSGLIWIVCAALASFGLIHANAIGIPDKTGTLSGGSDGMPGWKFIGAYGLMAFFCFIVFGLQRLGWAPKPYSVAARTVDEVWNRPCEDSIANSIEDEEERLARISELEDEEAVANSA